MFYTDIILVCCIVFCVFVGFIGWAIRHNARLSLSNQPDRLESRLRAGKCLIWIGDIISIGTLIALVIMLAVQH